MKAPVLLAVSLLAICSCGRHLKSPEKMRTEQFLNGYLRDAYRGAPPGMNVRYGYSVVDLNGDGMKEIILYRTGHGCAGGCGLIIFTPNGAGWREIGGGMGGYAPIKILPTKSHGWADLASHAPMVTGAYDLPFRFDGKNYRVGSGPPSKSLSGRVLITSAGIPLSA